MIDRDRDADGRARNARARDELGRLLPPGSVGVPPLPEVQGRDATATLDEAQRLLTLGLPFQAHEVLEARWKVCPHGEREYWQGLAQAAVALTHLRRGNTRGAQRIAARALANLARAPQQLDGLPTLPPTAALAAQLHAIAAGNDTGLDLWRRSTEERS